MALGCACVLKDWSSMLYEVTVSWFDQCKTIVKIRFRASMNKIILNIFRVLLYEYSVPLFRIPDLMAAWT